MRISRRNKANPEFSLAAMTDVILLLLIFFMITSSAANQNAIDVKLPKGENNAIDTPNPIAVSIKPDGSYYIDEKPVEAVELENFIVTRLQNAPHPSFTIRADKNCLHKDVVFVMEIAEKHKYNIAIATTTQSE
ncbi:biopolymer transporter ExbD [Elizabethkingia argentiflava]|uniref:Biopolymer transporter ExbD n=1 Tax=Elizabethkingia argenteiflava TaxID=2681556 RepID=A0A845PSA0_9FLAO|nr:biopolymer transporter ExbD [Elizabethkingia argenteiflava]NAW50714.1 biopolymer transporter ExbD [Elizabethkingia argenteiflava]